MLNYDFDWERAFCGKRPVLNFNFRTYFRSIFAEFLWVWKFCFFLKNFRTSITKQFQNSQNWKVLKIPSNAWPYFCLQPSILSMFYTPVFHTKFWRQKLQSCNVTRESCTIRFCTKKLCIKCWWNWPLFSNLIMLLVYANSFMPTNFLRKLELW